jgi:hypothetical protein
MLTMHKHLYAFAYYLMHNTLPLSIKYFDNPLITFQNDSVKLLHLKKNLNNILQIFFFTVAFEKQLELSFFL